MPYDPENHRRSYEKWRRFPFCRCGKLSYQRRNFVRCRRQKEAPHKIDHMDLCYQLFIEKGFHWGGDWEETKDYQHFQLNERRTKA